MSSKMSGRADRDEVRTGSATVRLLTIVAAALLSCAALLALPSGALAAGDANSASCPALTEASPGFSAALPDCRAYELVSPANAPVDVDGPSEGEGLSTLPFAASDHGEAVAYLTDGALPGATSMDEYVSNLATRAATGWLTTLLSPPSVLTPGGVTDERLTGNFSYYTPDLDCGIEATDQPLDAQAAAEPGVTNLYMRDNATGAYTLLSNTTPSNPDLAPADESYFFVDGASEDCSNVVFESFYRLLPGAPATGMGLYEWDQGTLHLVSEGVALAGGNPTAGGGEAGATANTLSADGSTVLFTAKATEKYYFNAAERAHRERDNEELEVEFREAAEEIAREEGLDKTEEEALVKEFIEEARKEFFPVEYEEVADSQIFARANGDAPVEVSRPQTGNGSDYGATFQADGSEGNEVLFTSLANLTSNANTGVDAGGNTGQAPNLYQYDLQSGTLIDLSVDENTADSKLGADVNGVLGASEDGAYVYFSALGQLVAGKGNTLAENEAHGEVNVYLSHEGQLAFVAAIKEQQPDLVTSDRIASRVSPNGQYLLFAASNSPTGYDNLDASTGAPDSELYEYSLASESVACVSCDPDGARPRGSVEDLPTADKFLHHVPRNLTDEGAVFFTSPDPLVPQAANGQLNVFEYEAGHVYLLDHATGSDPSEFVEASANGEDVYLVTHEALAGEATSGLRALYDVRVDGGFGPRSQPPVPCSGEGCQGSAPTPPTLASPASTTQPAGENLIPSTPTAITATTVTAARLTIIKHSVTGKTATILATVSTAGKLVARGSDLTAVTKSPTKAKEVTLKLKLTKKGSSALAQHPHRALEIKVKLVFTPNSGAKVSKTVTVSFPRLRGTGKHLHQ